MEVTPEISDGYEGIVRRLICLDCQKPFYITKEDCDHLKPLYCTQCSLKWVEADRRRTKEAAERAEQWVQHSHSDEVKAEVFSPEDKMILYAVLQDIADEVRKIDRERRKQQKAQEHQSTGVPSNADAHANANEEPHPEV
jgi:hypothetical protein